MFCGYVPGGYKVLVRLEAASPTFEYMPIRLIQFATYIEHVFVGGWAGFISWRLITGGIG
jgi:hypothetical protein